MLSRLILSTYGKLIEIVLWVTLIGYVGVGSIAAANAMGMSMGISGYLIGGILGSVLGLAGWLLMAVLLFGVFLIIEDIRKSVKAIEEANNK